MIDGRLVFCGYARISKDRDGKRLGVRRQEAAIREYITRTNSVLFDMFVDNDMSAYSGKPLPDRERMYEAVRSNPDIDGILIVHLDRIVRNPYDGEDLCTLGDKTNTMIVCIQGSDFDLTTSDGRAMARVIWAFARKEVEDKSRRIKAKNDELALAGLEGGGGTRPFGYELDRRHVRKSEARVIKDAVRRISRGETLWSIIKGWNEIDPNTGKARVPPVKVDQWSYSSALRVLTSPRTAGLREHRGKVVAKAEWPGIISEIEHYRMVELLAPNKRERSNRTYLLTHLLTCHYCKRPLQAVARPLTQAAKAQGMEGTLRAYGCRKANQGCGGVQISADLVEPYVVEMFFAALDGDMAKRVRKSPAKSVDAEELLAAIDASERQLEDLARRFAKREIIEIEWAAMRRAVAEELDRLRTELAHEQRQDLIAMSPRDSVGLRRKWNELSITRQHAYLASAFETIEIRKSKRGGDFDTSRVLPIWRI